MVETDPRMGRIADDKLVKRVELVDVLENQLTDKTIIEFGCWSPCATPSVEARKVSWDEARKSLQEIAKKDPGGKSDV